MMNSFFCIRNDFIRKKIRISYFPPQKFCQCQFDIIIYNVLKGIYLDLLVIIHISYRLIVVYLPLFVCIFIDIHSKIGSRFSLFPPLLQRLLPFLKPFQKPPFTTIHSSLISPHSLLKSPRQLMQPVCLII